MTTIEFSNDDVWSDERREATRDKIESLKLHGRHLTRWEREFLDSAEQPLAGSGLLTSRQQEILDDLYDRKLF